MTYVTTTDANGHYHFSGLPVDGNQTNDYRVTLSNLPPQYTTETYGPTGVTTPGTATFTLGPTQDREDINFGYRGNASDGLGDFVWDDTNGNGIQNSGEPGVDGISVQLYDSTGTNLLATTTTANGGQYQFIGLTPGTYQVKFGNVANGTTYAFTAPNQGSDPTLDSNANPATGFSGPALVTAGSFNATVDAGLYRPLNIGSLVWYDVNGNGIQDSGEPGISGATVTLTYAGPDGVFGTGDDTTATTTTGADGSYLFANQAPGNYRVTVSNLPAGLTAPTYDLDGVGTPNTTALTAVSGSDRLDANFGYQGTGSAGSLVWYDVNGNGTQQMGEPGLGGVRADLVYLGLTGQSPAVDVGVATTNSSGNYLFSDLPQGFFQATVDPTSLPLNVNQPTFDLDGTGTPNTATFDLTAPTPARSDVNFGYTGGGTVGSRVWDDVNGNGIQDAGEPGIPGVRVMLVGAGQDGVFGTADDAVFASQTTDANGNYLFTNVGSGLYKVSVDPSTLPAGFQETFERDGTLDNTVTFTRTDPLEQDTNLNFGYRGSSTLAGFVYRDYNLDGQPRPMAPTRRRASPA